MLRKRWSLLLVLVLISSLVIAGCGGGQQASGPSDSNSPSNQGAAPQEQIVWRMQVIHGPGQSDFKQNQQTAEEIYKASNGRLKIEVYPNGTFASSLEAFQAAGEGVFEMHSSWPSYVKGIEYAFLPLGTGNMAMDSHDKYVWMYEAGGWDLMQKAFDKLNLKLLAVEIWGTEVMMANEPFTSIKDMKGKKMRTSDPRLLAEYGVSGITMPLEEVFTAMSQGAVDAAEFGHLKYNEGLGLTDISKYAIYPDFWNVHNVTTVVVNKHAWNKLPPDLQKIVELAFKAREFQHWTKSQYESAVAMTELKDSGKMEFVRMNPEDFAEMRAKMYQIEQKDIEQYGGLTKEVYESIYNFEEVWFPYKHLSRWWGADLTPEQQLGYDPDNK